MPIDIHSLPTGSPPSFSGGPTTTTNSRHPHPPVIHCQYTGHPHAGGTRFRSVIRFVCFVTCLYDFTRTKLRSGTSVLLEAQPGQAGAALSLDDAYAHEYNSNGGEPGADAMPSQVGIILGLAIIVPGERPEKHSTHGRGKAPRHKIRGEESWPIE